MMQMFKYPQGEGGLCARRHECEPDPARGASHLHVLASPPLLYGVVKRRMPRQLAVSTGGRVYGD
jgi:hypothetical protein